MPRAAAMRYALPLDIEAMSRRQHWHEDALIDTRAFATFL